jgi:hypothetical protein
MRIRMVSALCVFLPLIYSPRPAAAQFNSSLPPMPQAFARKLPSPGKLSELQTSAGYRGVGTDAELRRRLRSLLQRRGGEQRPEADAMGIRSPFEAGRCAHIDIIQAPDVDSKMMKEVPKDFASNMPMWQGPQPCCGDFLGTAVIPRAAPLVNPGHIGDWPLKPGMQFLGPQP